MLKKSLKSRVRKIGMPPGALIQDETENQKIQITVYDYTSDNFTEKKDASLDECLKYLNTTAQTWINICGITDTKVIQSIGNRFGIHPLVLEDIASSGQRSKIEDYKDTLFIVAKMLTYNETKARPDNEQVSFVLGKNYVISFLESPKDFFVPVQERLKSQKSRLRERGSDYLCYALLDCLVDNYFLILEKVDDAIEIIDEDLIRNPTPMTLKQVNHLKMDIIQLRKAVWPMREVISNFRRMESPLIQDSTKLYLQDVYDHTIQAIDTIESFRDIVSGMVDIYLSNMSQKMNEIMKVLTIVSTIFVPLTFISSLYGMNFKYMPELNWEWGYFSVIGVMVAITLGMLYYFKRKRWI